MPYQDRDLYDESNNDQNKFINELFENPKKSNTSEEIPLDKSKEISQDDLNPRMLTEKTASKNTKKVADLNLDSSKGNRKKPNLSLISTDSTIDSENFTNPQDHQNNSFSTPFSGASGSFNNSGKLDFSSPVRIDSGRINSEVSILFNLIYHWLSLLYKYVYNMKMSIYNHILTAILNNNKFYFYCVNFGLNMG